MSASKDAQWLRSLAYSGETPERAQRFEEIAQRLDLLGLLVDPQRFIELDGSYLSNISVRAKHPEEGWGSYNIEVLEKASLVAWLRSCDAESVERVVCRILGYLP